MVPVPITLGLTLCAQVMIEKGTENVSLIGSFNRLRGKRFPFIPLPFWVFATLTGGQGNATLDLTGTRLETDEEIHSVQRNLHFPHRFAELQVAFRLAHCEFPAPGMYSFNLLVDGEWIANRRLQINAVETPS
jgi:hypothetical protein